jgi:hypothetical protein
MGSAIVELTRNREIKIALAKVTEKCQISREDRRTMIECYRLMDIDENGVLEYSELFFGLQAALHHYPLPVEVMDFIDDEQLYRRLLIESRNDRKLDSQGGEEAQDGEEENLIIQPIDKAWFVAFVAHMNMKTAHTLDDEPRYRSRLGFKHLTQALSVKSNDVRSSNQQLSFEAAGARILGLEQRLAQKQVRVARLTAENMELETRLEAIRVRPIEIVHGAQTPLQKLQWKMLSAKGAQGLANPQPTSQPQPKQLQAQGVTFGVAQPQQQLQQQQLTPISSSDQSKFISVTEASNTAPVPVYTGGGGSGGGGNDGDGDQDDEPGIKVYV